MSSSVGPDRLCGRRVRLCRRGRWAGFAPWRERTIGLSVGKNGRFRGGKGGRGYGGRAAPVLEGNAVPVRARMLPFLGRGFSFADGGSRRRVFSQSQHLLAGTPDRVLGPSRTCVMRAHGMTRRWHATASDVPTTAPGVLRRDGCGVSPRPTTGR